jgi:hypothetical protein
MVSKMTLKGVKSQQAPLTEELAQRIQDVYLNHLADLEHEGTGSCIGDHRCFEASEPPT